ncbi:hypothetical protein [Mesorhizobium sp. M7A.F.Ca.CA.001.08.2.1]|uniref:hypothetical protein n=1 Tax=Mesorhizobium sp. M7A.F.Ca.CA.001.08.2.1 TaxID=2496692 RepID=UPI00387E2DCF
MGRRGNLAGAQHAERRARPSGRRHIVETLENRCLSLHARFIQRECLAVHFVCCQAPLWSLSRGWDLGKQWPDPSSFAGLPGALRRRRPRKTREAGRCWR